MRGSSTYGRVCRLDFPHTEPYVKGVAVDPREAPRSAREAAKQETREALIQAGDRRVRREGPRPPEPRRDLRARRLHARRVLRALPRPRRAPRGGDGARARRRPRRGHGHRGGAANDLADDRRALRRRSPAFEFSDAARRAADPAAPARRRPLPPDPRRVPSQRGDARTHGAHPRPRAPPARRRRDRRPDHAAARAPTCRRARSRSSS